MKNKGYATFGGGGGWSNKVYFWRCASGELTMVCSVVSAFGVFVLNKVSFES